MTNIELKELIQVSLASIKDQIKANSDLMEYKFSELKEANAIDHGEMIAHQKITNSRVTKLEDKTKILDFLNSNKKLVFSGAVAFWILLFVTVTVFGIPALVGKLFN